MAAPTASQVEEALRVLYTTTDTHMRTQADQWLRGFQDSAAAWQIAVSLVAEGQTDAKFFGATVLCNKLRGGGGGGLTPEDAKALRSELLKYVGQLEAGKLRSQLARAVASLVEHPSELLADAQFGTLHLDVMLQIFALVPDCSCWLTAADVDSMNNLSIALLDFAYAPGRAAFPSHLLPAQSEPALSEPAAAAAIRCAVVECANA